MQHIFLENLLIYVLQIDIITPACLLLTVIDRNLNGGLHDPTTTTQTLHL